MHEKSLWVYIQGIGSERTLNINHLWVAKGQMFCLGWAFRLWTIRLWFDSSQASLYRGVRFKKGAVMVLSLEISFNTWCLCWVELLSSSFLVLGTVQVFLGTKGRSCFFALAVSLAMEVNSQGRWWMMYWVLSEMSLMFLQEDPPEMASQRMAFAQGAHGRG